jgi:hypothetical protein
MTFTDMNPMVRPAAWAPDKRQAAGIVGASEDTTQRVLQPHYKSTKTEKKWSECLHHLIEVLQIYLFQSSSYMN